MTDPLKRPRGRPRKIRPGEAETPATQVSPVAETSENPIRVGVEEIDALTGDVIAVYDDPGDEVELPALEGAENEYRAEGHVGEALTTDGDGGRVWTKPVFHGGGGGAGATQTVVISVGGSGGASIPQLDHDHDGRPGGSLPRARLTDLQVSAYTRDLMDAYMGQHEVKRADGWNRVWTMRHEIVRNHDMMLVRCARGPLVGERLIPASQMSNERAEEAVRAVDQETER